jgi:hypothetical protein
MMMRHMACPEREKVVKITSGLRCIDDRSGIILRPEGQVIVWVVFLNDVIHIFWLTKYEQEI